MIKDVMYTILLSDVVEFVSYAEWFVVSSAGL